MTKKKKQSKAAVTELSDKDLDKAQGGFTAPGDVAGVKSTKKKKATASFKAGADLQST